MDVSDFFIYSAKEILTPRGFNYLQTDECFINSDPKNYIKFFLHLRKPGLKSFISFQSYRRYHLIEDLWVNEKNNLGWINQFDDAFCTLSFNKSSICVDNYEILKPSVSNIEIDGSIDSIKSFFIFFEEDLINVIFPFLNRFNDIRQLDAYLNNPADAFLSKTNVIYPYGLHYRKMIIAKLAGNPDYEKVCEAMLASITQAVEKDEAKYKGYLTAYHNVVERLKTIEPLKNPILGQML